MIILKVVSDFNSIKVRLEHKFPQRSFHSILYFNSIKVRLEQVLLSKEVGGVLFQFHKGAIRTIVNSPNLSLFPLYFNSIKVRLEHASTSNILQRCSISIP